MPPARPAALAFDVVETLFSLAPVRRRLAELTGDGSLLDLWFAWMLRDAFAIGCAGGYVTFSRLARATLGQLVPDATDVALDHVVEGFSLLEPHPDAAAALEAAAAEVPVVTLTNGSADSTGELLRRAGLDRHVSEVISVEEVQAWKPRPQAYRHAAARLDLEPARLALVAVHGWDVHGAKSAGCSTGWCARLEGRLSTMFNVPDVSGHDLLTVVERLLALPGP